MYRIASTIIHFKYFEHLRSLNVANFFFCTVQNHVWPSLLGSQERTRCVEPPSQKLPNYWRDLHQASTSIQKWRSKSRRPDIYRPILRNIMKHLQLPSASHSFLAFLGGAFRKPNQWLRPAAVCTPIRMELVKMTPAQIPEPHQFL